MNALKRIGITLTTLTAVAPVWAGETVLHSFNPYPQGAYPQAMVSLCSGPAGMLFGTANGGGPAGGGVVYRVNNTYRGSALYGFTGGADGGGLVAGVTCGSDGNIYGTTLFGGSAGAGVVYRVESTGQETVLYNFTGGADGGYPFATLIQDPAGNLYGTTCCGGSNGAGNIFRLDTKGHETVLYSFTGGNDGAFPYAGLVRDSAGNLYGTTCCGGSAGAGNVFKLSPSGQETVLYSFTGGNDGGFPFTGALVLDSAGNLYGTTNGGGQYGAGVVYKLSAAGQENVVYSFTGGNDGGYPYSGVILDAAGNLYGTTPFAGANGVGLVYKVDPSGNETVPYTFTGKADGGYPTGIISDSAGNLYGAANFGGTAGGGLVFKMDTAGHERVLYSFPGVDGGGPSGGVIQDAAGNFYGTTGGGGPAGVGVIYKLDTKGRESILYSFTGGGDGANPSSGLIMDSAGNLYGTASGGGPAGSGVVFKLDPTGHETVLYSFTGQCCAVPTTDGVDPQGGVIMDSAGNLYGTTAYGGSSGWGTVYKLDPTGHETILHNFTGAFTGPDGGLPLAGVTLDSAGNLYGTTDLGGHSIYGGVGGVAYKLDPAGNETVLYDFCSQLNCADGVSLFGGLTLDSAGNLYGNAWSGGPPSGDYPGVVYKLDPTGHETVVYAFTGFSDGGGPIGNPLLDSAGNVYGVTQFGGQGPCPFFGCGVVFEVDPTGHETVLYSFTGFSDGSMPTAGVIRDSGGNLYGTTWMGGAGGAGVVYKIGSGSSTPPSRPAPPLFQLPAQANRPAPPCVLPFPQQRMGCPSAVSRQLQPATL